MHSILRIKEKFKLFANDSKKKILSFAVKRACQEGAKAFRKKAKLFSFVS
jgi:hypothetical protein